MLRQSAGEYQGIPKVGDYFAKVLFRLDNK